MKKAKILIVDDRPENLLVLESLIEDPNIELVAANSGEEALMATLDHSFALVLLDVNMPGMSGYEVAELMRGNKMTKNIPIIFVTAEQKEQSHMFKGYDAGAVDYLFKPLEPVVLQGKISVFLELYFQKTELEVKTKELDSKLIELGELQKQLEESNEKLMLLSITDGLTGLINRRRFDEVFEEEWHRAARHNRSVSLLMIDIDNFKLYNDNYGHPAGDETLKIVAAVLAGAAKRNMDTVARYGGEEFIVVLPDTDVAGAEVLAEKMRQGVYSQNISHLKGGADGRITISVGIASKVPERADDPHAALLSAADTKLYEAKETGKNCCRS